MAPRFASAFANEAKIKGKTVAKYVIKYKYFQSFFNLDTKLLLFPTDLLVITTVNGKLWSFPVEELSESGLL